MSEWTGVVVAKSPNGIKVKDKGAWLNFTKDDWRGTPFHDCKAGDKVRIEYDTTDDKTWISVLENLSQPQSALLGDDPFPPDDAFPPDDDFRALGDDRAFPTDAGRSPDAPRTPPEATEDYGQSLWAKDRLRARTDCVACATGIFKSCLEAGILKEFPSAAAVVAYAIELEKWAKE